MTVPSPLLEFGQSPWYDNLTRALATGGLQRADGRDGIRGVTSNPTIFEKAMAAGDDYDAQLRERDRGGRVDRRRVLGSRHDRHRATRPTSFARYYDDWDGADGFVSIEVSPDLAHDTDETVAQAERALGASRIAPT